MACVLCLLLIVLTVAAPAGAQEIVATGVAEDATESNSQPKIGFDSAGTVHLAFVKPSGGRDQIFVASSPGGRAWSVQQVTRAVADARYPTLAVGPDGRPHLAWTQYDGGVGKVYYAQREGQRWTNPVKLSPGVAYAGVPAIAVDAQNTIHLVWYGIRADAPAITTRHGSIYEILYTSATDARWTTPQVISPGIPDSVNPALVLDDGGRPHSAWYQFDLRAYQVRHTRLERTWSQPETLSAGGIDAFAVTLAAGRDGTVYALWERREAPGSRVYMAEYMGRWSGQQVISPGDRRAFAPTAAVDAQGRLNVVWETDGQIDLRRRDGQWLGIERLTRDGRNVHPIIAAGGGSTALMWTQELGGDHRLVAMILTGGAAAVPRSRSPWGLIALIVLLLIAIWQWRRISRRSATA